MAESIIVKAVNEVEEEVVEEFKVNLLVFATKVESWMGRNGLKPNYMGF